jgi:hypothetical protein
MMTRAHAQLYVSSITFQPVGNDADILRNMSMRLSLMSIA